MREIKLTHRITATVESEDPLKDKAKVARRGVRKTKEKTSDLKDRDRVLKEKKKLREDDSEVLEAETKYYEAVQKVKELSQFRSNEILLSSRENKSLACNTISILFITEV